MQRAIALLSIAAVLLFSGVAFASNVDSEAAQYAGHIYVDVQTGESIFVGPNEAPAAGVDIYSNVASPAVSGISSTSIPSIWGDRCMTTGLGILSAQQISIFNAGTSAGALLTCTATVLFRDYATSAVLGGYSGNINFGAGLNPGFYSLVTFVNLETLATPINLTVNDLFVTQQVTATTGAASRLGVALLDPVTIGSSPSTMYISSPTIGGGVPGYYTVGTGNANPAYRINAIAPVATEPSTWGKVKSLYR